jgi:hypothetical protein
MIVEARTFTSGAECIAHAAEIRFRFFKPNVKPIIKIAALRATEDESAKWDRRDSGARARA